MLDQERCILCSRCIRTCDEVAGQHQLEFANRGDHEVLTTAPGEQLDNPYSLNTVDVCPVGALTVEGLPVHDARVGARGDADASATAARPAATSRSITRTAARGASCRATTRTSTSTGCATRVGSRITTSARSGSPARLVDGLPAGWDRAIAAAAKRLGVFLKDAAQVGVVLSALHTNEDNFALATLAKAWGVTHVFVAGKPPVPARADGRLRVADVNPNTAGVKAIAEALGLATSRRSSSAARCPRSLRALVVLGDVLPGVDAGKLKELEVIAIAAHERGPVAAARSVALPAAAWAEVAGTITNNKGRVQRMHAAFAPPGQAIPGVGSGRAARARDRRRSSRGRTRARCSRT